MFLLMSVVALGDMSCGLAEQAANALLTLALAAIVITGVSCTMFYAGLRRYESGSALHVNVRNAGCTTCGVMTFCAE